MFSDRLNPWMVPIAMLAPYLIGEPRGSVPDNPWMQFEHLLSQGVGKGLDHYRQVRDAASERAFNVLYGA